MYKKKRKYLYALFAFMLIALICIPSVLQMRPQAAAKPGTVKLTKITATDYNKINIKWKKTSGATNYIVYYRKNGVKKWTKVKTLDSSKSSYTHTSSSKYPIVVGQKYQYTVKAYNSKTKKSGSYNTKGLTTNTIPQTVVIESAKPNKNGSVSVFWNKAGGASKYIIYAKRNNNAGWSQIGSSTKLTFIDKNPVYGEYNIYTIRGCTENNILGKYDTYGIRIYISKKSDNNKQEVTITPTPTATPMPGPYDDDDEPEQPSKPTPAPDFKDDDDITTPSLTEEQFANEIFRLTNVERAKRGEPLVKYNDDLHKAAMQRAKEISVNFSHYRPNGKDALDILDEYVLPDYNAAENIAAGYSTPQETIDGWMDSQGHRVALLNGNSTHLGVGVCKVNDVYYCVQLFTAFGAKEKLTIDANGGYFPTLSNVSVYDMYFYENTHIKFATVLPTPVKDGCIFVCWETEDGCRYSGLKTYAGIRLHAIWKEN